jgi:hypothetical protein
MLIRTVGFAQSYRLMLVTIPKQAVCMVLVIRLRLLGKSCSSRTKSARIKFKSPLPTSRFNYISTSHRSEKDSLAFRVMA